VNGRRPEAIRHRGRRLDRGDTGRGVSQLAGGTLLVRFPQSRRFLERNPICQTSRRGSRRAVGAGHLHRASEPRPSTIPGPQGLRDGAAAPADLPAASQDRFKKVGEGRAPADACYARDPSVSLVPHLAPAPDEFGQWFPVLKEQLDRLALSQSVAVEPSRPRRGELRTAKVRGLSGPLRVSRLRRGSRPQVGRQVLWLHHGRRWPRAPGSGA
jgi:hypothetical protein